MQTFKSSVVVQFEDLDCMGHVSNGQWHNFLLRARLGILEQIGFSFSKLKEEGFAAVVSRVEIDYLRPGFYGQSLEISSEPVEIAEAGILLQHVITNQHGKTCIKAMVRLVAVNSEGRSCAFSPEFLKKLQ